jgi:hypothetical protein
VWGRFQHSYLKFAVTGLTGRPSKAVVMLYVTNSSVSGGEIYRVSNNYAGTSTAWTEYGLTWINAPTIAGSALSWGGSATYGQWVSFPVTAAIAGNGTLSFAVTSSSSDGVVYRSREYTTNRPTLVVTP